MLSYEILGKAIHLTGNVALIILLCNVSIWTFSAITNSVSIYIARIKKDRFICILNKMIYSMGECEEAERLKVISKLINDGWGKKTLESMLQEVRCLYLPENDE